MILVTSLYRDFLVSSWGYYHADVLGLVDLSSARIGLFLVPFLLFIRLLPVISIFETKEVLHEEQEEAGAWLMRSLYGLLAEFETPGSAGRGGATRRAREGYRELDAFTPFPVEELDERAAACATAACSGSGCSAACSAVALALGMQFFTNFDYPINVGGRPLYRAVRPSRWSPSS